MVPIPIKRIGFRSYQGSEKNQCAFELRIQQQRLNQPFDPFPHFLYIYYGDKNGIRQLMEERNSKEVDGHKRIRVPKNADKLLNKDLVITTTNDDSFSNFQPSETFKQLFTILFSEFDHFLKQEKKEQPPLLSDDSLLNEGEFVAFMEFFQNHFPDWIEFERKIKFLNRELNIDSHETIVGSQPFYLNIRERLSTR